MDEVLLDSQLSSIRLLWSFSKALNLSEASSRQSQSILEELISDFENESGIETNAIQSIAHRVVHGGSQFTNTEIITNELESQLEGLCELAPVHNPIALKIIRAARKLFGEIPNYAVFDTSFHSTLQPLNYVYPIPYEWHESFGIRRFGFHGINHKYCAEKAVQILSGKNKCSKIITCHLGNGCSVTAVKDGKSVDTSMGFTPLEGLMMGTRSGTIDPGIIFYLIREKGFSADLIESVLNGSSGLLGVSGVSRDMREIEKAIFKGDVRAKLAFEMFVQKVAKEIALMCTSLGGMDVLVFTGGIGEHSSSVRTAICDHLQFLGVELDSGANNNDTADGIISDRDSSVVILRIAANEELSMLHEVLKLKK